MSQVKIWQYSLRNDRGPCQRSTTERSIAPVRKPLQHSSPANLLTKNNHNGNGLPLSNNQNKKNMTQGGDTSEYRMYEKPSQAGHIAPSAVNMRPQFKEERPLGYQARSGTTDAKQRAVSRSRTVQAQSFLRKFESSMESDKELPRKVGETSKTSRFAVDERDQHKGAPSFGGSTEILKKYNQDGIGNDIQIVDNGSTEDSRGKAEIGEPDLKNSSRCLQGTSDPESFKFKHLKTLDSKDNKNDPSIAGDRSYQKNQDKDKSPIQKRDREPIAPQIRASSPIPTRELVRYQVMLNDTVGRLYADIERLFKYLGFYGGSTYSAYITNRKISHHLLLDNIACYLETISIVNKVTRAALVVPKDETELELWRYYLSGCDRYRKKDSKQIYLEVLEETISMVIENRITSLPEDLETRIYNLVDEDCKSQWRMNQGVASDNGNQLLKASTRVQSLSTAITNQQVHLKYNHPREVPFNKVPLIGFSCENLKY